MLFKLILQNVKKSLKEYAVYIVTLIMIVAFMQAFNSLIFAKDIKKICSMGAFIGIMIGFAGVIVFCILFWLIRYMVRFMMQKRSKEFASYLVLGLQREQIATMFMRENFILGCLSLIIGMIPGTMFQILLNQTLGSHFSKENQIHVEFLSQSFLLTAGIYLMILILVLIRNSKNFKKMKIIELLNMEKKNELLFYKGRRIQQIFLPLSVVYFIWFDFCLIKRYLTMENSILFLTGFVISCYLLYRGASAAMLAYVEKKRGGIYKGSNLFLFRQILSKIRTIRVTMGTITIFFSFAFVSFSIAIMFHDYLNNQMNQKLPFDVIVYENNTNADFKEEEKLIKTESEIIGSLIYRIYETGNMELCEYMMENKNGSSEVQMKKNQADYFAYDTFMKLSDYNALRNMLGYEKVKLEKDSYLIHTKKRFVRGLKTFTDANKIEVGNRMLTCVGFYTEGFSQNGQNGADYIIVVPDACTEGMREYYSLYAASLKNELSEGLYNELNVLVQDNNRKNGSILWGRGTDDFVTTTGMVQVKSVQAKEVSFVLTAISYPLIYIGIIMLCVGVTILSVHQLSDLPKCQKHYAILKKMGVSDREAGRMIGKQMAFFYLIPYLIALVISAGFTIWMSVYFIYYTGLGTSVQSFFLSTFSVVTVIYGIYFGCTYLYMKRACTEVRNSFFK